MDDEGKLLQRRIFSGAIMLLQMGIMRLRVGCTLMAIEHSQFSMEAHFQTYAPF